MDCRTGLGRVALKLISMFSLQSTSYKLLKRKTLLSIYYVPGTVLNTDDAQVNGTQSLPIKSIQWARKDSAQTCN